MQKRIGFIGAGNMGSAIIKGVTEKLGDSIAAYDVNAKTLEYVASQYGSKTFCSSEALCAWADILLLAVKPQYLAGVLESISGLVQGKAVASIAAGWTSAQLKTYLPKSRICRIMPNTPAMVGEGMTAIAKETDFTPEELNCIQQVFSAVGKVVLIEEKLMSAVVGVSGSGPAYGFMVIEAMADAGVREGLTREAAIQMAAQTLLGASKMVLETGEHPAILRDKVCSPGGTTIEAVAQLEARGVRAALQAAVRACVEKSDQMAQH